MHTQNFSDALAAVTRLVAAFQANEQTYLDARYSEAQARLDFIDKFWAALGWDVNHEREKNPYEQEVKVERGVAVGNRLKKADYAFFAAPNFRDVKFYVEAKKPARNLDNPDDFFQTLRYGWSSNTPLAVLTDFEQFRVVDCRYKPNIKTAENFAVADLNFTYRDYADEDKFRQIYHLFSREAVLNGALETYAKSLPKRGRSAKQGRLFAGVVQKSVDESFLDDLDTYRAEFARAFKNKNPSLDGEELTEAVTRTLDRLVFMRFLEDKLIEPDTLLDKFASWADFTRASARLNAFYNGIVFKPHFIDSAKFNADEKVFADICDALSPVSSPYNFNYIPVHILGSIYERFLGKVITATDKRAKVEDKPEVRKAGGVYYTPEYIVRYIVENTVGKLLADKTPAEVAALRLADIACGSGSFLLGVYDYLLRWHAEYFNAPGKKTEARAAGCVENADGSFTLSIAQRREILRNNIYGVDIDAQAVEVAQLSLALKLLEDATTATTRAFQPKLGEKLLPDLSGNIVCGNSLIDWDILDGQLFERADERKLNPMSYADKFPAVMQRGGFDAIVGNPPYRMLQPHNTDKTVIAYLKRNYLAAEFKIELFHLFLQKGISLIKESGKLGFIVPTTILNNVYAESLRAWILNKAKIDIIAVAKGRVFADADVHTSVLNFTRYSNKSKETANDILTTCQLDELFTAQPYYEATTSQKIFLNLQGRVWNILINNENASLIMRLIEDFSALGNLTSINRGLITGDRDKYFSPVKTKDSHFRIIAGGDVQRYFTKDPSEFILFERPKSAGGCWDKEVHFASHKIVIRQIGETPTASILKEPIAVTGNIFTVRGGSLDEEIYLLGIINSKLIEFFWRTMFADFKKSFPQVTIFSLSQLPIRVINFADAADKALHDKMVALVEQMLAAKRSLQTARSDKDKNYFQDRCANLDRQIDALVYQLYDLTAAEIRIIENAA